jgi:hypothetical protein
VGWGGEGAAGRGVRKRGWLNTRSVLWLDTCNGGKHYATLVGILVDGGVAVAGYRRGMGNHSSSGSSCMLLALKAPVAAGHCAVGFGHLDRCLALHVQIIHSNSIR